MLTTILVLAFCCSLVGTSSIDPKLNNKYIDGNQYKINHIGITYTQRVSPRGKCSVELNENSKLLSEGEVIKIKHKWYKVEECQLNRAYPVPCGSKLFYQLRDIACSIMENNNNNKNKIHVQRQTKDVLINLLDRSFNNSCCESACTVSELVQNCPTE